MTISESNMYNELMDTIQDYKGLSFRLAEEIVYSKIKEPTNPDYEYLDPYEKFAFWYLENESNLEFEWELFCKKIIREVKNYER